MCSSTFTEKPVKEKLARVIYRKELGIVSAKAKPNGISNKCLTSLKNYVMCLLRYIFL